MGDLDKVTFGSQTVDRRTAAMLTEAQRLANLKDPSIGKLTLSQGSFSHEVSASGGTHDGAGAFDLSIRSYSSEQKDIICMALRTVGFASWHRFPNQGPWPEHVHGIAIGSQDLASGAQAQVRNYLSGTDGLRGNHVDHQARPKVQRTWEQYEAFEASHGGGGDTGIDTAATHHAKIPVTQPTVVDPVTDPYDIAKPKAIDYTRDSDGDGLSDAFEKLSGTDPNRVDTDGNGIRDSLEAKLATTDLDGDHLSDAYELRMGLDPTRIDSDGDGVTDWLAAQSAAAHPGAAFGAQAVPGTAVGAGVAGGVGQGGLEETYGSGHWTDTAGTGEAFG